jgi:hypothetical protein
VLLGDFGFWFFCLKLFGFGCVLIGGGSF